MHRAIVFVILGTGCGSPPGVDGRWEGTCLLDSSTSEATVELDLRLEQDGDEVSGQATAQPDWLVEPVVGAVSGTVVDDAVALSMILGDTAVNFDSTLDGSWSGETMSGPCATEVEEGTYTLDRTETDEGLAPG